MGTRADRPRLLPRGSGDPGAHGHGTVPWSRQGAWSCIRRDACAGTAPTNRHLPLPMLTRLVAAREHPEPGVGDHLQIGLGGLSLAGQIIAEEQRVGQVQRQRLQRAQMQLPTARDPDLRRRARKPRQRQNPQATLRVKATASAGRRPA